VRVTLFHNPSAGDAPLTADQLQTILSDAGYQVRYQSTKDDLSGALEDVGDLAVVAGGDGTVATVARALADTDIPLAVLPLGTANNIGKALGVFGDVRDIVAGWADAPRVAIDIGVVRGPFGERRFIEAVGVGVLAELIRRGRDEVDDASAIVHRATDRALQLLSGILRGAQATDIQVELDGDDLSGSYIGIEVMNVGFAGPNIPLAAQADPADGELDLVLLREDDRQRLLEYTVSRVESASALMPRLDVRRGRRVRLVPPAGWSTHVDDGLVELETGGPGRALDILIRAAVVQVIKSRPGADRR
jgi:diacylglycerol kinase family enzyme